ncbi:MAG: hypothetical protein ACYTF3_03135 [Planctomycetota bacterium]|jgi:hypothetical protein
MQPLLFVLGAIAVAVMGYFGWQAEKRRREAFGQWAAVRGWTYRPERDRRIRATYGFLDRMQVGHSRRATNVLRGEWDGYPAAAFTFRYKTGSGKNETTHWFGVALIHIDRAFPEMRIHPEGFLSRIGQALGYDDIDFESVDFSNAYTVRSRDRKLAFDFCHTGMMEYLLAHRGPALELEGNTLALFVDRRLEAADLDPLFRKAARMRELMPEYLFRD